jgi:MipA family protein
MSARSRLVLLAATGLAWASLASHAAETAPATAPDTEDPKPPAATLAPVKNLKPLWELGLGVSGVRLPDYRGSNQSHNYLLPLPYVMYRGTWLRSDRDGTRAMLFDSPRVKLDLSFGAAAPARSENAAREGMPDLPGNLEVQEVRKRWTLDLRLPVRGVMTLESSPRYAGATFSPNLNFDLKDPTHGWNVGLLTGPLFANRRYHAQYYQVDAAYVRPDRPAYQARGGYAGWQTIASTSKRFGHTWFGAFARLENLNGAVYADSPMVKRNSALTVGFGVSWVLATSETLVDSRY